MASEGWWFDDFAALLSTSSVYIYALPIFITKL